MTCPKCDTAETKVIRTIPGSMVSRHHECKKCKRRWWSDDRLRKGSLEEPRIQAISSPHLAPSISSPSLSVLPGNPDQTRVRNKPDANVDVSPNSLAKRVFIEAWEQAYGEKYAFEKKDGIALAAMLKAHPEFALDWKDRVGRYLANKFWGNKRHPLHVLASNAREFGAPMKNGAERDVRVGWAAAEVKQRASGTVEDF